MRRAWVALLLSGCLSPEKDDGIDTEAVVDTVVDTDTDDGSGTVDTDTDLPLDTDTDAPVDTEPADTVIPTTCKEAGGICTTSSLCGGRTVLTAFAADCVFDDGPGVCCEAPKPKPMGDGCTARGGVCAPMAGCGFVDGWRRIDTGCTHQGGVGTVCCLPEAYCGPPTGECCNGDQTTSFVSTCNRGVEDCSNVPGTVLVPIGTCLHTGTP